jgi:hypothetical protein
MCNIINLTPHPITLRNGLEMITVNPSGKVARVAMKTAPAARVPGIPVPVVPSPEYGEVEGLPGPEDWGCDRCVGDWPGTAQDCRGSEAHAESKPTYLVSAMVLARCVGRDDVFAPDTSPNGGAIRDEKGQVIAVTRLVAAPTE